MYIVIRLLARLGSGNIITVVIESIVGSMTYITLCLPYVYIRHRNFVKELKIHLRKKKI